MHQKYNPQDYLPELFQWIGEGKTLSSYCRQPGKPSYGTVYDWLEEEENLSQFARARVKGQDAIAEECLEIIDSADDANLGKARVWTRLQLLAKWNPKKYGERTVLAGDPEAPLVLAEAIAKARKRAG